jgi:hypothetical protein
VKGAVEQPLRCLKARPGECDQTCRVAPRT